jgi:hypothetical protein
MLLFHFHYDCTFYKYSSNGGYVEALLAFIIYLFIHSIVVHAADINSTPEQHIQEVFQNNIQQFNNALFQFDLTAFFHPWNILFHSILLLVAKGYTL